MVKEKENIKEGEDTKEPEALETSGSSYLKDDIVEQTQKHNVINGAWR